jgi:hypothetical protein
MPVNSENGRKPMAVNIEVKEGSVAEITGPAMISVTSDVPGSVLVDGEPVFQPPPDIPADATPATAVAGDATDIDMIVEGSGFTPASVISFNGLSEPTTFIDDTQVSTGVKPSLFTVPADCPVAVRNGQTVSNSLTFSFTATAQRSSKRGR